MKKTPTAAACEPAHACHRLPSPSGPRARRRRPRPAARWGLDRQQVPVPGHRQIDGHDRPGHDRPDREAPNAVGGRPHGAAAGPAEASRSSRPGPAATRGPAPQSWRRSKRTIEFDFARPERPEPAESLDGEDREPSRRGDRGRCAGNCSSVSRELTRGATGSSGGSAARGSSPASSRTVRIMRPRVGPSWRGSSATKIADGHGRSSTARPADQAASLRLRRPGEHARARTRRRRSSGRESAELAEDRQSRADPGARRSRARPNKFRAGPEPLPAPQGEGQRRDRERLARHVGHRPVGVETIERIEHQQQGGDRPDPPPADQDAAQRTGPGSRARPSTMKGSRATLKVCGDPNRVCECRTSARASRARAYGDAQLRSAAPIEVLRQRGQVEGRKIEPGRIVELAGEE